ACDRVEKRDPQVAIAVDRAGGHEREGPEEVVADLDLERIRGGRLERGVRARAAGDDGRNQIEPGVGGPEACDEPLRRGDAGYGQAGGSEAGLRREDDV